MITAEAATVAAAKVTTAAVRGCTIRGATEVAVVGGARAGFCCRNSAGGARKPVGGDEVRSGWIAGDQGFLVDLSDARLVLAIDGRNISFNGLPLSCHEL